MSAALQSGPCIASDLQWSARSAERWREYVTANTSLVCTPQDCWDVEQQLAGIGGQTGVHRRRPFAGSEERGRPGVVPRSPRPVRERKAHPLCRPKRPGGRRDWAETP